MTTTQTAVALVSSRTLSIIEIPISAPKASEVLIKVQYALFGAADGHAVADQGYIFGYPQVLGGTCVGIVLEVGSDVAHVKRGDSVGAFTQPGADRATQQFVVAPGCRVNKIPESKIIKPVHVTGMVSSFVTAWWTLIESLRLPLPLKWPADVTQMKIDYDTDISVLIWGAGTASGQYTIQLLRLFGFTNIIGVASARSAAKALEQGATHVVDYNDINVEEKIKTLSTTPIRLAVDTIATTRSLHEVSRLVTEVGSKVAVLMPYKPAASGQDSAHINEGGTSKFKLEIPQDENPFAAGVEVVPVYTYRWESNPALKDNLLINTFPALIQRDLIKPQPVRIFNHGSLLERVEKAAAATKRNELGGERAVIDIAT